MSNNLERLLSALHTAFDNQQLMRLTLSVPQTAALEAGWKNIYLRAALIKKTLQLSVTYRYARRDEVKNYPFAEGVELLRTWLPKFFTTATLLTTTSEWVWQAAGDRLRQRANSNNSPATNSANTAAAPVVSLEHNRSKNYLVAENAPFLQALGLSSGAGRVHAHAQDKYRQINKYLEIMDAQLPRLRSLCDPQQPLHLLDMGSGKGYLSFALFAHWQGQWAGGIRLTGVELRADLVEKTNKAAEALGFAPHLQFVCSDIATLPAQPVDVLIALHACDTATDLALYKALQAKAALAVAAPCCHKELRAQLRARAPFEYALSHGIFAQRQAEMLTDTLRALLMEREGYRTQIFEFVDVEHTAKNLLLLSQRTEQRREEAAAEIAALKAQFGIEQQMLESLLATAPQ